MDSAARLHSLAGFSLSPGRPAHLPLHLLSQSFFREPSLSRVVLLLLASALVTTAWAETIRVPENYPSIEGALDAAVAGDSVLVAAGEYVEGQVLIIEPGISLVGAGRDLATVVVGVVHVAAGTGGPYQTRIEGLSVIQADGATGQLLSSDVVADLHIVSNRFEGHTYIRLKGAVYFALNEVLFPDPFVTPLSFFSLNTEDASEPAELHGNVFFLSDGGIGLAGSYVFDGNTVVYPWMAYGAFPAKADFLALGGVCQIRNNILFGTGVDCRDSNGGTLEFSNNGWWYFLDPPASDCELGPGSFEADPLFCNLGSLEELEAGEGFDWRLMPTSPCIGAGSEGQTLGALGVGCQPVSVPDAAEVTPGVNADRLRVFPTPSTGTMTFEIEATGHLRVFDAGGRSVWERPVSVAGPGTELVWDGTTFDGERAESGVYFITLTTEREIITAKGVLLPR